MSDGVNLDLFEPFDRLLRIRVRGRECEVPENNTLLRGFQYLYGNQVVSGRFCWNNECGNCEVICRLPGEEGTRTIRGCQTLVEEGMQVTEVSSDLALFVED
jgi:predicted molibdopterin-dependent oxidoreductase YjgC